CATGAIPYSGSRRMPRATRSRSPLSGSGRCCRAGRRRRRERHRPPAANSHKMQASRRRLMRTWHSGVLACLIAIGVSSTAHAQNAQIAGVVKDQSGAVIPGATITAKNVETGLSRIAVTDSGGEYRWVSPPPGRYSVATELSGFSTETRPDIVLIIDQTAIINFALKPAALSETVTVTGESPIVDVTRSDVSTSVSTMQIQDL